MRRVWISLIISACLLLAGAIWFLWPAAAPQFAEVRAAFTPSDAFLLDRNGELLDSVRMNRHVRRFEWQQLNNISPALLNAVVQGEDARFWQHHGIDWRSVGGALRDRVQFGRRRGASTITMQVASLLDAQGRARQGLRAWQRKRNQVRLARALEAQWSKQQILEAYLNLLQFRSELQGIDAAARILAGKVPSGLSLAESLVIAALLPEPAGATPRIAARACGRARHAKVAIDCALLQSTATQLLGASRDHLELPRLAPHLADALLRQAGQRVRTTLDAGVQRTTYAILRRQLAGLADRNVRDGAALVVENATGHVLAYVGSAGPRSRAAQVDGVRGLRQAGSTLKPFLYGLALERGYLTAGSLLKDSPVHLDTASGAYIPQDYDKQFRGLVSVRTALGSSLNIPAVRALVLVGVEPFRDRLYQLGYQHITEAGEYYGYSLALGSAEVSLWEQAQAYRTLVNGGASSPLQVLADAAIGVSTKLVSTTASFIITDILSDSAARVGTFGMDNALNTPFWSAAKTGTSKDMRDNWCIGFSSEFTVAVWVGNFEGDSMHDVSGVTGAAPVWHEILTTLHQQRASQPPLPPQGVEAMSVKFTPATESPRREWFLAEHGAPAAVVTPPAAFARITSPANGMVIALDPDIPPLHQKVAISAAGADAQQRFKLDGQVLGTADALMLWAPVRGAHRLELEQGNGEVVDRILFTVR